MDVSLAQWLDSLAEHEPAVAADLRRRLAAGEDIAASPCIAWLQSRRRVCGHMYQAVATAAATKFNGRR